MNTMTLNIQDKSIMPYLVEMLGKIKGVSIVNNVEHKYSLDDSLSKEEGEKLVCETLNANRIVIVACGTSWHAALIGKHVIQEDADGGDSSHRLAV